MVRYEKEEVKRKTRVITTNNRIKSFITDEDLAEKFQVSIQTVRLDRMELSIPELRERLNM